ncbi:hypothetical protein Pmar_PMAR023522 [Perkinsus marinus ATCC 50983]|uniref:Metallo-beta-lactamase domain-containing protein n=1 Tax=Perkinsus marinus (strain ATCC 50983 / TXsc) TaxID=423536 RepID=C5KCK6_PERM5|nr:hypothetical protein Pmar_PMAR023522 [Perkinsus marinus ATCC 50983]EER17605.1 hypothetical protein Pmar_PMAR023522 [Perkinsus marinus ATCC 50983]|eukprot:XP_002785809.1 hypothetical protein Pmar_PMAR023522 [Perkinsus marinus ATCC 50983]
MSRCVSFLKVSFLVTAAWIGVLALWLGYELKSSANAVPASYLVHNCSSNPRPHGQQALAHPDVPYGCGMVKLFSSPDVSVEAYIQPDGGKGWSNAGRFEAYGHVYQVDALIDKSLAEAMSASSELGPADTLLLTSSHIDHIGGIIAHENITTAIMHEDMRPVVEGILASSKDDAKQHAAAYYLYRWFGQYLQPLLSVMPKPLQRLVVGLELGHYYAQFDSDKLDHLSMEVATFDGDLGLVRDHIQLKCFGPPTHSCLDCIVIVPEAKVVFTGDILFVGIAPIMTRESAQKSLDALAWLEERIDSSWKLVPGHGPVTSLDGLQAAKHYYRSLQEAVDQEGCSCLDNHTMCGLDFYTSPPEELRDWTELQRSMVNAFVECEIKEGRNLTEADFTRLAIDAEVLKELRSQSQ